jgi:membrane-associated phospholipid phosphatase
MKLPVAKFISFVLNPLLILFFIPFFVVFKSTQNMVTAFVWTAYTFAFIFAIGIFLSIGVWKGIFTDFDASRREQRSLLYFFAVCLGIVYVVGLYMFSAPYILKVMAIGLLIGIVIASIINTRIKASIHTATLSGLILGLVLGYGGYFTLLFLLIPIMGKSRISLKRHTFREVVIGWILGSLISLCIYAFLVFFVYK